MKYRIFYSLVLLIKELKKPDFGELTIQKSALKLNCKIPRFLRFISFEINPYQHSFSFFYLKP